MACEKLALFGILPSCSQSRFENRECVKRLGLEMNDEPPYGIPISLYVE